MVGASHPAGLAEVFVFPQSRAQRRLWALAQTQPDSVAYAIPLALRLIGTLDVAALERSLTRLLRKHEIFRTAYGMLDGQPVQLVYPDAPIELVQRDLGKRSVPDALSAEASRAFDLRRPEMLRATLFRCGPGEHVLSLVVHHIACDGWSLDRLVKEICGAYGSDPDTLPDAALEGELQYGDFALWEEEAGDALLADLPFWRERLKQPVEPLDLHWDDAPASVAAPSGQTTRLSLQATLTERVATCARSFGTTPFTVQLSAFSVLLHRLSGAARLRIATPIANRARPEFEPLIGLFVNTLLLDIDIGGDPSFAELVERCGVATREAFAHSRAPIDEVAKLQTRERFDTPLFHAMFALQSAPLGAVSLAGLTAEVLPVYPVEAKFDLTLMLQPERDALQASLEHRSGLLRPRTATEWLTGFECLLDAALAATATPLSRLPLHRPGQHAQPFGERRVRQGVAAATTVLKQTAHEPPETPTEVLLASIWAAALKIEPGRNDSFFSLGGDSIQVLKVVSLARAKGLRLTPRQLLSAPTLQAAARDIDGQAAAELPNMRPVQGTRDAALPLTPILSWFQGLGLLWPDRWAQTLVFELRQPIPVDQLGDALRKAVEPRLAFRQRIMTENGHSALCFAGPLPETLLPLDQCVAEDDEAARGAIGGLVAGLSLQSGPLGRALLISRDGAPRFLALAIHHVAIDAVSWSELLQAVWSILSDPNYGVPTPPADLADWHAALEVAAASVDPTPWLAMASAGFPALQRKACGDKAGLEADTKVDTRYLTSEQTSRLVQLGSGPRRSRLPAILISSLCTALAPAFDGPRVALTLEHHGRDAELGVDVAATIGWFTALTPLVVDHRSDDGPLDLLGRVAHALAAIAPRQHEYGLARWLGPDRHARELLDRAGLPDVSFNFLGTTDTRSDSRFALRPDLSTGERDGANGRAFTLDVGAAILDGRLRMDWHHSERVLGRVLVAELAERWIVSLGALLDALWREPLLAMDHPLAQLRQDEFRGFIEGAFDVETISALLPLQEGMLFEADLHARSGAYHEQITAIVEGPLDPGRFAAAWQSTLDRHEVLRASFLVRENGRPLQIIGRGLVLPVTHLDWSDPDESHERCLANWLREDASQPFDVACPPLMRLAIAKLGPGRHRWMWSYHHILLDGWSLPIVLRDVLAAYRAELLVAPRPFTDQIAWLASRQNDRVRSFWAGRLAGLPPSHLALPARAAPHVRRIDRFLSAASSDAVTHCARGADVTPSVFFNAAWALLLAESGLGRDVVFGITVAGRSSGVRGIETMPGLFINTLPLRVTLRPNEPVRGLLARLQREQADLVEAEHDRLSDILRVAGAQAGPPFDTLVVFENYPQDLDPDTADGIRFGRPDYHEHTNFPVSLGIIPGERIMLRLEHDCSRFSAPQADQLVERLVRLLDAMVTEPDRTVGLVSADPVPLPPVAEVMAPVAAHRLFDRAAARWPDAVAVDAASQAETLTYAELDRRAEALSRRLRRLGAGAETVIGVMLPRSPAAIVAMLGVFKAGAAYLPLDLSYPAERLDFMLRDSGVRIVLRGPDQIPDLGSFEGELVDMDDGSLDSPLEPAMAAPPAADHLAYVIYTSGSTGLPKAVGVTHRGIAALCRAQEAAFALTPRSRVFQFAPLSFDASISEILTTLSTGGTLVLPPRGAVQSDVAAALAAAAGRRAITHVTLPPSLLAGLSETDLPGIGTIVVAGEAAPEGLLARWAAGRRVVNAYGPTEATVCASMQCCDAADPGPSIGAAIEGTTLIVLNEWLNPCGIGVPGEICIGGTGLARGYLRRPGETARRFIPDPYGAVPGARLFRTGDRGAHSLADGRVRYLGRASGLVKIRGVRIEPDGIAAVLSRHEAVREALVLVVASRSGQAELVAAVVTRDGGIDPAALRTHAARLLSPAEMPSRFIMLDRWPLTPAGKIDRAKLLADSEAQRPAAASGDGAREPGDGPGYLIRDAFRQVLSAPDAGMDDDYFDLGGDSILALQVSAILRRHGIEVGPGEVLQHRTPACLAEASRGRWRDAANVAEPDEAEVELSPIQSWFLSRGPGAPVRLTLDVRLSLAGPLDEVALGHSLRMLGRRHEALRLRLVPAPGGWRQVYGPRSEELLPLDRVAEPLSEQGLSDRVRKVQQGLDPVHGPMARAVYVADGPGRLPELIIVAHHLIVDVASWRILLEDLDLCYAAASARDVPAPPLAGPSFRQWTLALRDSAAARLAEREFWQRMVGATATPDAAITGAAGTVGLQKTIELHFDEKLTTSLTGPLTRPHDMRSSEILLAAFARTWGHWAGGAPLRVDVEGHGRQALPQSGLDPSSTVGWFTCVYPLRIETGGGWDVLLPRVRDLVQAVPHGGEGFGILSRFCPANTIPDHAPRAVGWNYLGSAAGGMETTLPGLGARLSGGDLPDARGPEALVLHPIEIDLTIKAGRLAVRLACSAERLNAGRVERLALLFKDSILNLGAWLLQHQADTAVANRAPAGSAVLDAAELKAILADIAEKE